MIANDMLSKVHTFYSKEMHTMKTRVIVLVPGIDVKDEMSLKWYNKFQGQ